MPDTCPSRTALRVAQRRAAHQILDEPRLFDDPLALPILGLRPETYAHPDPAEQTPYERGLRAFLAVRSRFVEDMLRAAVRQGVGQYVVLGAGLDTFGCRNPFGDGLRVFEVDRPAVSAWKRDRLAAAGIPVPSSLGFAAMDFASQGLREELCRAGFDPAAPAFFSWLGVTQYLAPDEVLATLGAVATLPAGSAVVFDYALAPGLMEPRLRQVYAHLARRVAAAGEPFLSSFDPAALAADLRDLGFTALDDLGAADLNARYFAGRSDGLRVGGSARIMHARI